jgi:hypothetical protein
MKVTPASDTATPEPPSIPLVTASWIWAAEAASCSPKRRTRTTPSSLSTATTGSGIRSTGSDSATARVIYPLHGRLKLPPDAPFQAARAFHAGRPPGLTPSVSTLPRTPSMVPGVCGSCSTRDGSEHEGDRRWRRSRGSRPTSPRAPAAAVWKRAGAGQHRFGKDDAPAQLCVETLGTLAPTSRKRLRLWQELAGAFTGGLTARPASRPACDPSGHR